VAEQVREDDGLGQNAAELDAGVGAWSRRHAALDVPRGVDHQYGVPQRCTSTSTGRISRASGCLRRRKKFARICTAHSPKAKGRMERAHGTRQDWLVKEDAPGPECDNGRWQHLSGDVYAAPRSTVHGARLAQQPLADFHRPAPSAAEPARLWQLETLRTLGRDDVVRYHRHELQLERPIIRGANKSACTWRKLSRVTPLTRGDFRLRQGALLSAGSIAR